MEYALDKSTINYRVDTETRLSCHEAIMLTTLARVEHFLNGKFNYLFLLGGRVCLWVCVITFSEWSDRKQEAKGNGRPARTKALVRRAERNLCWRLLCLYSNSSQGSVQVLEFLWFSIIWHPTLKKGPVATNTHTALPPPLKSWTEISYCIVCGGGNEGRGGSDSMKVVVWRKFLNAFCRRCVFPWIHKHLQCKPESLPLSVPP